MSVVAPPQSIALSPKSCLPSVAPDVAHFPSAPHAPLAQSPSALQPAPTAHFGAHAAGPESLPASAPPASAFEPESTALLPDSITTTPPESTPPPFAPSVPAPPSLLVAESSPPPPPPHATRMNPSTTPLAIRGR